jgi:hypothetical protein
VSGAGRAAGSRAGGSAGSRAGGAAGSATGAAGAAATAGGTGTGAGGSTAAAGAGGTTAGAVAGAAATGGKISGCAAGGPGQLQQQVEERLVDRIQRRDANDIVAVGPLLEVEAKLRQRRVELEVGLAEGRLLRQPHRQRRRLVARHRGDLDFGPQRLAQG